MDRLLHGCSSGLAAPKILPEYGPPTYTPNFLPQPFLPFPQESQQVTAPFTSDTGTAAHRDHSASAPTQVFSQLLTCLLFTVSPLNAASSTAGRAIFTVTNQFLLLPRLKPSIGSISPGIKSRLLSPGHGLSNSPLHTALVHAL